VTSQALRDEASLAPISQSRPMNWSPPPAGPARASCLQLQRAAHHRRMGGSGFREGQGTWFSLRVRLQRQRHPEALDFLRPWIVAYKVDLKGFNDQRYRTLGGTLAHVQETIRLVRERGLWLEVLTLIVPGFNDGEEELRAIARFIAGLSRDIPWHVTAFHKDYKMTSPPNTTRAN